jgi:hypothetical protein
MKGLLYIVGFGGLGFLSYYIWKKNIYDKGRQNLSIFEFEHECLQSSGEMGVCGTYSLSGYKGKIKL